MNETKTSKEIYDALIAAGVQIGDLVRFSDETTGFVYRADESRGQVSIALRGTASYHIDSTSVLPISVLPTHFATPFFSRSPWGEGYHAVTTIINYPKPDPLTLEQRIERLEKLQGVEK